MLPKILSAVVDFLNYDFLIILSFLVVGDSGSGLKIWLLLSNSFDYSVFSLLMADF